MIIKVIINKYHDRYSIPEIDLTDFAETNRFHTLVASLLLFAFGLIDFCITFFSKIDNLKPHLFSLVYFGIFTVTSPIAFILSTKFKNTSREKAYQKKTLPFYFLYYVVMGTSIFNFYLLGQPFNGVLSFCMTGIISLSAFSFSPIPFLIGILITMAAMIPGIF